MANLVQLAYETFAAWHAIGHEQLKGTQVSFVRDARMPNIYDANFAHRARELGVGGRSRQSRQSRGLRFLLGLAWAGWTEQLESISRQGPRKKRRNSGAYFERFCGEPGVKAAEMRPSGF